MELFYILCHNNTTSYAIKKVNLFVRKSTVTHSEFCVKTIDGTPTEENLLRDFCETQTLKFGLKRWASKSNPESLTPSFKVRIL